MTSKQRMAIILTVFSPFLLAATSQVTSIDEVQWGHLNPLRGDKSPGAADLWGDRTSSGATGMLVRFKDGFSSPPHIHNVSYRGIVIKGALHNDDPHAANMWMPVGSFWTQPAGEAHITSAQGQENLAYVEIDSGPYLVKPTTEAFDEGERPINVERSNLVWVNGSDLNWVKRKKHSGHSPEPEVAFLWGSSHNNQLNGLMLKIPPKFKGSITSKADEFRAVVVQGTLKYDHAKALQPGSYFESTDQFTHPISTDKGTTLLYIRTKGSFELLLN